MLLTLFGLFLLLPVVILPLLHPVCFGDDFPFSGAVSGGHKGVATGQGDAGGGPYRSDSMKSMVTEGVKVGRWQTVHGHMPSGAPRPTK